MKNKGIFRNFVSNMIKKLQKIAYSYLKNTKFNNVRVFTKGR